MLGTVVKAPHVIIINPHSISAITIITIIPIFHELKVIMIIIKGTEESRSWVELGSQTQQSGCQPKLCISYVSSDKCYS